MFSLVVLATYGWSGCELIDTSLATDPSLQPHELPRIGQTPLPVIANNEVSLTIRASERVNDVRFKTGDVPKPQVDNKALEQLLIQLTVTLDVAHVALFAVLDSTGTQWNYGYTNLSFDEDVLEQANGKTQPFLFTRINEDGFMVVVTAILPDTPSALLNFRRYLNVLTPSEVQPNEIRSKRLNTESVVQSNCGGDGVYECAVLTWENGNIDLMCWPKICIEAESLDNDWWNGGDVGGGSGGGFTEDPPCMADPLSCLPGGGSSIPSQPDCSGMLNGTAYWDPVCPGRCVGGNTNRRPAPNGTDCSKLNLPCAGDPVNNPILQIPAYCPANDTKCYPGGSGLAGARFTVGENAVRNSGRSQHWGTDIKCRLGEPIYPLRQGRVVFTRHQRDAETGESLGHGRYVDVQYTRADGSTFYVRYSHLQDVHFAQVGTILSVNSPIGYCGKTGNAANDRENDNDFSHVHIEASKGRAFNDANRFDPETLFATQFDAAGNVVNANPCNQ